MAPVVIATLEKNRRERVRVALDEFEGVKLIDLRVTVEMTTTSGLYSPTKKGLALRVEQLPALVVALVAAEAKARELGLIAAGAYLGTEDLPQ